MDIHQLISELTEAAQRLGNRPVKVFVEGHGAPREVKADNGTRDRVFAGKAIAADTVPHIIIRA